jgi:hypothetical protein
MAKQPARYTEYMPISKMEEAERNPKGHDSPRIQGAIARFGFMDQAILDERTGRLVGGHGRLAGLIEMRDEGQDPPEGIEVDASGEWLWPVTRGWSSRSDVEAEAALVALNRLTELGGWDDLDQLGQILENANAVDPTLLDVAGYTQGELDTLLELARIHDGNGDDDEDVLTRTDREGWPRISCQVPPDVFDMWRDIPGNDDADRVMVALRSWQQFGVQAHQAEAHEAAEDATEAEAGAA